ncbi:hypothetical protein GEMRC1_012917 [Eukaryota sp. GEM-RC1]
MNIVITLEIAGALLIILCIGFIVGHFFLSQDSLIAYVFVLNKILLPAALFRSIAPIGFDERSIPVMLTVFLASFSLILLLSPLFFILRFSLSGWGAGLMNITGGNVIVISVPIVESLFERNRFTSSFIFYSLFFNLIFILPTTLLLLNLDYAQKFSSTSDSPVKYALIKTALNPIIIAVTLGSVFGILRLPIPTVIMFTVEALGRSVSPVGLFSVGVGLGLHDFKGKNPHFGIAIIYLVGKMILLPLLILPFALVMNLTNTEVRVLVIYMSAPSTIVGYLLCKEYRMIPESLLSLVFVHYFRSNRSVPDITSCLKISQRINRIVWSTLQFLSENNPINVTDKELHNLTSHHFLLFHVSLRCSSSVPSLLETGFPIIQEVHLTDLPPSYIPNLSVPSSCTSLVIDSSTSDVTFQSLPSSITSITLVASKVEFTELLPSVKTLRLKKKKDQCFLHPSFKQSRVYFW